MNEFNAFRYKAQNFPAARSKWPLRLPRPQARGVGCAYQFYPTNPGRAAADRSDFNNRGKIQAQLIPHRNDGSRRGIASGLSAFLTVNCR
jgi:hypothetical protein